MNESKIFPQNCKTAFLKILFPISSPDLITVRDPDDDDDSPEPRTIVAVEVSDTKNGATHIWSQDKLR